MPQTIYYLNFDGELNISIRPGDLVYQAGSTSQTGGFDTTDTNGQSNYTLIGTVIQVWRKTTEDKYRIAVIPDAGVYNVANNQSGIEPPLTSTFIFFAKKNETELSSIKGYYGSMTLKNNSKTKAELFAVSCDVDQSSK